VDDNISLMEKGANFLVEETDVEARPRRKGLEFDEHDLQRYVDGFFSWNEGTKILDTTDGDPNVNDERFQYDDKEKQIWLKERETLTMDWKRKRKYAMTRINKRMKVR
jgi:hypothetical protein